MTLGAGLAATTAPAAPAAAAPAPAAESPLRLTSGTGEEPAAADLESASAAAAELGESVEVADRTSEYERHLANPDGTVTYESYVEPQRVRRTGGEWVPVDTSLHEVAGRLVPGAAVLEMSFSAGGSGELLRLVEGERWLALSWPQELPVPVVVGDTATYPGVWPGVDLVVRAEPDSFAMALVVRSRHAAAAAPLSRVQWQIASDGLTLAVAPDGSVTATAVDTGEPVFSAPPSAMWDSPPPREAGLLALDQLLGEAPAAAPGDAGPGRIVTMPVELTGSELAVLPDLDMLADAETTYPVWVDPSFSRGVANWAPTFSGQPGTSWSSGSSQPRDVIRAGNLDWPGCGIWCGRWRSHLRFSISSMGGEQLVGNPTFRVRLTHSASCNATPVSLWRTGDIGSSANVTWNNGNWMTNFGNRSANANKAGGCGSAQPDVNMEWSNSTMRSDLQARLNAGTSHYTFGLRAATESDRMQWKTFATGSALLIATYNSPPHNPDRLAIDSDCYLQCSSPAVVRSLRPWLEARVRDPHGAPLRADFQVRTTSGSVVASGSVNNVNSGGTARWRPPSNLSQETTYRFRVQAHNQHLGSSWSSEFTFTVDTNAPNTPTVSSTLYSHKDTGTWNGGVGQAGSFSFGPNGSNDVIEYRYRWLDGAEQAITVSSGASATVSLSPGSDLEQVLQVRSIDRAGNISDWRTYAFLVRPQPVDVAYWKFDEGAGDLVAPVTGAPAYTGTLHGDVTWGPSGISPSNPAASGTALAFNGNGYVSTPRVLATNHAAGWSVTAWVYPTDLSNWRTVLAQDGERQSMFRLQWRPDANGGAGGMCVTVQHADSPTGGQTVLCAPAGQVQVGQWSHVAAVYDRPNGTLRLYIDGGPDNGEWPPGWRGEAAVPAPWAADGGFQIGRARTGETGVPGNYWHGRIDEVRAHQRALSEFEIQHTFLQCRYANCPEVPASSEPVLVGRWHLDEGAGETAHDSSGMNNHGSFHGGAAWTAAGHQNTPAVQFDGQSGYLAADGPVLVTDQSYTVAAWARIDELGMWHTVVAQEGSLMSPFRIMYRHSQDGWCFVLRMTDTVGGELRLACGPRPQMGVWTHLAGVYDASAGEARLYVNGVLVATAAGVTSFATDGAFLIGRTIDQGNHGDRFPGTIDDVYAYQTALTGAQVWELYQGTGP